MKNNKYKSHFKIKKLIIISLKLTMKIWLQY